MVLFKIQYSLFKRSYLSSTVKASMALITSVRDSNAGSLAVNFLQSGSVIAVPTDTVYGLACDARNVLAIDKLYSIKGRDENKPLAICLGSVDDVKTWARIEHLPAGLLSALLPGPVTLLLQCAKQLDKSLTCNGKVGLRIPNDQFLNTIVKNLGNPLALTSANLTSQPSSIKIEEFSNLWNKLAGVFDGGNLGIGELNRNASTIVDLTETGVYNILREGIAAETTSTILADFGLKNFLSNVKH